MRKRSVIPFLIIFCALLWMMSRSKQTSENIRGFAVSMLSPLWNTLTPGREENDQLLRLQIENQMLKNETSRSQELLKEAFYLKKELQQLFSSEESSKNHPSDLKHLLKRRLEAVPARVIYRPSTSWNSFFWIDVGQSTNETLSRQVIAKNSPVVIGNSLVGAIDYVGKHQSRVRLITDNELYPAVRAVRGYPQAVRLVEVINILLDNLTQFEFLFTDQNEKEALFLKLEKIQDQLSRKQETLYLAKGELQGCCSPHHRSHGNLLKGIGFNYDYADEKGPARDLRSGIPYESGRNGQPIALLKVHDILATSGMDGIFPEGLQVAEIVQVDPLDEGAYFYELRAKPTAGNLDTLSLVFVMSPQGFDSEEM
ncbi:MAG: rod shape-determining protein MreC [Parachlamydiaceae bacterium]|nr:rod shape-determining protein MreC [Parachlamydiaceae bacterium]